MSERIHGLAQVLPDKNALTDYRLEELQHLTKRFPYFAPAQFLLLQKLKESGSPAYDVQQCKAVLYYHDPLQFDYFISAGKFLMKEEDIDPVEEKENEKDAPVFVQDDEEAATAGEVKNEEKALPENAIAEQPETNFSPLAESTIASEELPALTEPDTVKEAEDTIAAAPAVLPAPPLTENATPSTTLDTSAEERETAEEPENNKIIAAPVAVSAPMPDKKVVLAEAPREKPVLAAAKGEGLLFEPFHTVDYFASQGIKITSEALPKDKLSHQLRSFTEWLKVMKRLPAAGIEAAPHTTAEKTVESMASHSVEGSDVVTEAMAEVWARQGNKSKAIETYNKLSLQNPSKKAYFAAKIENLSGT